MGWRVPGTTGARRRIGSATNEENPVAQTAGAPSESGEHRPRHPRGRQRRLCLRAARRRARAVGRPDREGTSSAAPACTAAASRPRRCCTPPRSPTGSREVEQFGVTHGLRGHRHGRRQHLQGRRRRPALQGPAGPGQEPQDHRTSRATAGSSSPTAVEVDGERYDRRAHRPRHRLLRAVAARPGDRRRPGDHLRPGADAGPGARLGRRARRRRHRRGVRQRLALVRRRRDHRRGAAPAGAARGRGQSSKPLERAFRKRGIAFKTGLAVRAASSTPTRA